MRPSAPSLHIGTAGISFSGTGGPLSSWGPGEEQQVRGLSETQAGSIFQVQLTYPALLVHFATLLRLAAETYCLGVVNIGHSVLG